MVGERGSPKLVELVVGVLSSIPEEFPQVRELLERRFGPVEVAQPPLTGGPSAALAGGAFAAPRRLRSNGQTELASDLFPFEVTHYYDEEMWTPIQRQFLAFARLIDPGELAAIKCFTNEVEVLRARERNYRPRRPVNLDPGYLDAARLVLATTKDRAHRIYLGQGIYAEVTLIYSQGAWQPLPWTYPDYRAPTYHPFLTRVRGSYIAKLRSGA